MFRKVEPVLAAPNTSRRNEFLQAVARSRELHSHWAEPPQTDEAFDAYMRRLDSDSHIGYWVLTPNDEIAGVINISEIVRGNFQSGYLGYYAFTPHERRGYMTAGLGVVLTRAFRTLHLHRVEANIQPGNVASRRLVERLGFRLEGTSSRYLKIAGRWRDHDRWAMTAEEWLKKPCAILAAPLRCTT